MITEQELKEYDRMSKPTEFGGLTQFDLDNISIALARASVNPREGDSENVWSDLGVKFYRAYMSVNVKDYVH